MGNLLNLKSHRLLRDQAEALGITYLEYRDLLEEKEVPLDVALENARRGITLDSYLGLEKINEKARYQETKMNNPGNQLEENTIESRTSKNRTHKTRKIIYSSFIGTAVAACLGILIYEATNSSKKNYNEDWNKLSLATQYFLTGEKARSIPEREFSTTDYRKNLASKCKTLDCWNNVYP